jgi:GNAT superfamily N-acetyltransferase
MEFEKSLNFDADMHSWFLARGEDGKLAGFLSVFAPSRAEVEISAYTRPEVRRSGVFTALLENAEKVLFPYGFTDELFLVEGRDTPGPRAGIAAAKGLGARQDFTEYEMRFAGNLESLPYARPDGLMVQPVVEEELEALAMLRASIADDEAAESIDFIRTSYKAKGRRLYSARLGGNLIGMGSIGRNGKQAWLNAIGIDASYRGKGLGRELLAALLRECCGSDLDIRLDVNSTNAAAFALYKKGGFIIVSEVHYYRRAFPGQVGGQNSPS